jgi:phosphatidylglycerophosphate synthase
MAVALLLGLAIASDYLDGPLARRTGTASATGMLFDHTTDCFFVTTGLTGAAFAGAVTPILPALIPFAFGQYVLDSYFWHRQRQLRASFLGRWNGILYFVPLVLIVAARLPLPAGFASLLRLAAGVLGYLLVASTVVSMIDRATTPFGSRV